MKWYIPKRQSDKIYNNETTRETDSREILSLLKDDQCLVVLISTRFFLVKIKLNGYFTPIIGQNVTETDEIRRKANRRPKRIERNERCIIFVLSRDRSSLTLNFFLARAIIPFAIFSSLIKQIWERMTKKKREWFSCEKKWESAIMWRENLLSLWEQYRRQAFKKSSTKKGNFFQKRIKQNKTIIFTECNYNW